MPAPTAFDGLNHRSLAMLRAVQAGRAQLSCSREPDLFIDGVACCDQFTAHALAHAGFIQAAQSGATGQLVRASITDAGLAAITAMAVTAA